MMPCLQLPALCLQVVVMTQRSKLEMEGMFRRCLPEAKRCGTELVCRQGSPLVPSDLKLVGASKAAATIVVSDQSRSSTEADAQAVRYGAPGCGTRRLLTASCWHTSCLLRQRSSQRLLHVACVP